jgi:2-amino-4-hydroxy-6-hydroxymethyldihydropteridine diphosphokinase
MSLTEVYLGLGSNIGDRRGNINHAINLISDLSPNIKSAPIYETEPIGFTMQPTFMNSACGLWTRLDPFQLLEQLYRIQANVGTPHTFTNGPRIIDIDILLYGQLVIDTPLLTIPHPRMHERDFVLRPLSSLIPSYKHPRIKSTIAELLTQLQ